MILEVTGHIKFAAQIQNVETRTVCYAVNGAGFHAGSIQIKVVCWTVAHGGTWNTPRFVVIRLVPVRTHQTPTACFVPIDYER